MFSPSVLRSTILCLTAIFPLFVNCGCTSGRLKKQVFGDDCLAKEIKRLEGLPEKQVITTLDGQRIRLDDFFNLSPLAHPGCFLPSKFYYWRSEVREVFSNSLGGTIRHKIRAYYNLTSTCYPEKRQERLSYGDVAEFYDRDFTFMGFAVYVGQGLYCPLPHAGYEGPASLEAATIFRSTGNKANSILNERKEG